MGFGEQRTSLDSNDHDTMELGEQGTRLLDDHERLDFADNEQDLDHNAFSNGKFKETQRIGWLKRNRRDSYLRDLVVAVVVGVLCGALGYTVGFWTERSPGRALRPDVNIVPLRVLVAGDSISQGLESMHTWRYRLWEWFQANNVPVTFVGPFRQTRLQPLDLSVGVPLPAPRNSDELNGPNAMDHGYAFDVEPEFLRTGSAHFSIWGREVAQNIDIISRQIQEYRPDYLLIELGFNDLAWGSRQPDEAVLLMEQFIGKAREMSPELRFAVANVPQRSKVGDLDIRTGQYNEKLREAIPKWSRPGSPVELVEFMEAYSSKNVPDSLGTLCMARMAMRFKRGRKASRG
ncbi:hypothetical protein M7I_3010 [Glarea lozoyensis 74030]|uniref:SGNH hydrolase-type esterase domain-containing protein n=1 Tax=Glarea lozoyensis (strain ATCC 74030 / MF5533) TaxID=1104152 RepID=H0EKB5_GLAL7|nr:hypothetical protein M7I_3010 [Glarea lozoyensis 74030]